MHYWVGIVVFAGGLVFGSEPNCHEALRSLLTLDVAQDEWQLGVALPDKVEEGAFQDVPDPTSTAAYVRVVSELERRRRNNPKDPEIARLEKDRQKILAGRSPLELAIPLRAPRMNPEGEILLPHQKAKGEEVGIVPFRDEDFIEVKRPVVFWMGSPGSDTQRFEWELPRRQVELKKVIQVSRHVLTQWDLFLATGTNPSFFTQEGLFKTLVWKEEESKPQWKLLDPFRPAETLSWDDAQRLVKVLNDKEATKPQGVKRYRYRLPTEAESEQLARGEESGEANAPYRLYAFGNDSNALSRHAWFYDNSNVYTGETPRRTQRVGSREPTYLLDSKGSRQKIFDVHGNVWEWTGDFYSPEDSRDNYRPSQGLVARLRQGPTLPTDPRGPESGAHRVIRGGGRDDIAQRLRSSRRNAAGPADRSRRLGVRLVREPW